MFGASGAASVSASLATSITETCIALDRGMCACRYCSSSAGSKVSPVGLPRHYSDSLATLDMPFLQLTFESDTLDTERLESACFAAGALSVTFTDAADAPILEPDLGTTPLWPKTRVSILFAAGADRSWIVEALGCLPPEH